MDGFFNPLLAVAQKDNSFAAIEDVKGRANQPQEPGPRGSVLALGDAQRNRENLTVAVECGHNENRAALICLDMAGVQADDLCGVPKRVDARTGTQEGPLENTIH